MAFKTFIDGIGAGQGSEDNSGGSFTSALTALITEGVHNKSRGDFEVTAFTGRTVNVAKGEAFIENDNYIYGSFDQKFVPVASDSTVNLSVDPNSSGSTRIDLVCITFDASVSAGDEGVNASSAVIVKGTAGAGTPATPDNHQVIGSLNLPSGFSTISSITDLRVQAAIKSDSHARTGLDLNNDKAVQGEKVDGTLVNLAKINTSDEAEIGGGGDTVIKAGASSLVKSDAFVNKNGTTSRDSNVVTITGWGFILGSGTQTANKTVTFGVTFADTPRVLINGAGVKSGSDPTALSEGGAYNRGFWNAAPITSTTFDAYLVDYTTNLSSSNRFLFSWSATGQIT